MIDFISRDDIGFKHIRVLLAADFASLSAISLPIIPQCPGIQQNNTLLSLQNNLKNKA